MKYNQSRNFGSNFLCLALGICSLTPVSSFATERDAISDRNSLLIENQQPGVIRITGTVVDKQGEPLPGVNITIKGTTIGTITGIDGEYTIEVPDAKAVLVYSYIGFNPTELTVGTQRIIQVTLSEDTQQLEEVVVTALGIKKKEKSLTYATQIVGGDELTRAKDPNLMNALSGKTAGVQISRSSSGLGGSVKVSIRGNRSAAGNNQPLYVVDGVPINSSSSSAVQSTIGGSANAGNRDSGDGVSDINPDDVESMNILKGPAAAALYGASAANGVVIITTKKGKAGRTEISFNSNTTWESAAYGFPEFQNSFTSAAGSSLSWGDKFNGSSNYVKDFFSTGITTINSLTFSRGSEGQQSYFSYANTYGEGVLDNSSLLKHNFTFRQTAQFIDNRLTLDANISLLHSRGVNLPTTGGYYMNPLVGLYRFPRGGITGGKTFDYYKDNYQVLDPSRNMMTQNWHTIGGGGWDQNPYWLLHKTPSEDTRKRTLAGLNASFKINKYLTLAARGNADYLTTEFEQKIHAGTDPALAMGGNGRYILNDARALSVYGDIMLSYQQTFGEFSVNANLGSSIKDDTGSVLSLDSNNNGLYNANIFTFTNIAANSISDRTRYHEQNQAVFFAGQVSYRDWLFLDVTARNDWNSTLAYTKYQDKGFFYPSVGLTYVLNQSLKLPEYINLGKIRGAWSRVGNGIPRYISHTLNTVGTNQGNIQTNFMAPFEDLKPEMTTSFELGTEWRMFNNRLEFDFTFYRSNTRNQLFTLNAPDGSLYSKYYINSGNIQNTGVEIVLAGSPIQNETFRWRTGLNFAANRNEVVELAEGLPFFSFGDGGSNSYETRLAKGGSFGDIYGRAFDRDENGKINYDSSTGLPLSGTDLVKIGNTSPKFNLGWNNTLNYKNWSLYMLFDGRFGGEVLSITEADLDQFGVTKRTGDDRLNGGVQFDGKKINDVKAFYDMVGGRSGVTEHYMYSATNIRLRELSLGYSIEGSKLNMPFIKNVNLSLVGRNLFFLMNNAPFDPDATMSVGNSLQGVDTYGMPSTRSVGFNLKVNF